MRNETGLNLGWVFAQKKPGGFFGYLPGFLNPVTWPWPCSIKGQFIFIGQYLPRTTV